MGLDQFRPAEVSGLSWQGEFCRGILIGRFLQQPADSHCMQLNPASPTLTKTDETIGCFGRFFHPSPSQHPSSPFRLIQRRAPPHGAARWCHYRLLSWLLQWPKKPCKKGSVSTAEAPPLHSRAGEGWRPKGSLLYRCLTTCRLSWLYCEQCVF